MSIKVITVLGFKQTFSKAKELKTGDVVELKREPHEKDKTAVKVYFEGESVGYVAASEKTMLKDTISAKEVFNMNPFIEKATLVFKAKESDFNSTFEASLLEELVEDTNIINFNLTGAMSTYPGKKMLIEDTREKGREIRLLLLNGEIIAEYDGLYAGRVSSDENTLKILAKAIEDGPDVMAETIAVEKLTIRCELNLNNIKVVSSVDIKAEIKEEVIRIMSSGIATSQEMRERLDYLRANHVPDIAIRNLFKTFKVYPENVVGRISKKPEVEYIDPGTIIFDSISFMNIGSHIRAEGEKGVGKNLVAQTLSWLSYRPMYDASLNSQVSNNTLLGGLVFESKMDVSSKTSFSTTDVLKGVMKIIKLSFFKGKTEMSNDEAVEIDNFFKGVLDRGGKELVFEKSNILEAFEVGGILVLDEFNTTLPHVMSMLNSVFDDRRSIEVTNLGKVEGDNNFCGFITQNIDYEGTFRTNQATVNRFRPLLFPQADDILLVLQQNAPNASRETIVEANNLYKTIMASVRTGQMDKDAISFRGFSAACKLVDQGQTLKDALIKSVANEIEDEDERRAVINMIDAQLG